MGYMYVVIILCSESQEVCASHTATIHGSCCDRRRRHRKGKHTYLAWPCTGMHLPGRAQVRILIQPSRILISVVFILSCVYKIKQITSVQSNWEKVASPIAGHQKCPSLGMWTPSTECAKIPLYFEVLYISSFCSRSILRSWDEAKTRISR